MFTCVTLGLKTDVSATFKVISTDFNADTLIFDGTVDTDCNFNTTVVEILKIQAGYSGTVTFVTAPTAAETVVLRRSTSQTQEMDLIDNVSLSDFK